MICKSLFISDGSDLTYRERPTQVAKIDSNTSSTARAIARSCQISRPVEENMFPSSLRALMISTSSGARNDLSSVASIRSSALSRGSGLAAKMSCWDPADPSSHESR